MLIEDNKRSTGSGPCHVSTTDVVYKMNGRLVMALAGNLSVLSIIHCALPMLNDFCFHKPYHGVWDVPNTILSAVGICFRCLI